jgi:carbonic anhydrase
MQTIKIYWNFTEKKWNLVEIGTIIPEEKYVKSYVVPAEAHFIDPRKSRLVRLAWKLHHIFTKLKFKL